MNTTKDQCTITEQNVTARLPLPNDPFKNLIDLHKLQKWSWWVRGEQLLVLLLQGQLYSP